jgi:hypothetical protein
MLLETESGQSYSGGELAAMMIDAELSDLQRLALDLPNAAAVMSGRKG